MPPSPRLNRQALALVAATTGALAIPASASAEFNLSITQAGGAPQELKQGMTVSDPTSTIAIRVAEGTDYYTLDVKGPNDLPAIENPPACRTINQSRALRYWGNGEYTVTLIPMDRNCEPLAGQVRKYTLLVDVPPASVSAPNSVLLARHAGSSQPIVYLFNFAVPVNTRPEFFYGRSAAVAGTSIQGAEGPFDPARDADGRPDVGGIAFSAPGVYRVYARGRANGNDKPTPWSPPATVRVVNPFEVQRVRFLDRTGPSYRVAGYFADKSIKGRIVIDVARGSRQKKKPRKSREYRRLGTVRIRNGRFTKRFETRRRGLHRLRFSFAGSESIAPGDAITQIRFTSPKRRRR